MTDSMVLPLESAVLITAGAGAFGEFGDPPSFTIPNPSSTIVTVGLTW